MCNIKIFLHYLTKGYSHFGVIASPLSWFEVIRCGEHRWVCVSRQTGGGGGGETGGETWPSQSQFWWEERAGARNMTRIMTTREAGLYVVFELALWFKISNKWVIEIKSSDKWKNRHTSLWIPVSRFSEQNWYSLNLSRWDEREGLSAWRELGLDACLKIGNLVAYQTSQRNDCSPRIFNFVNRKRFPLSQGAGHVSACSRKYFTTRTKSKSPATKESSPCAQGCEVDLLA